jgi:tRNA A-37 threonylcarbamoyl transferase component Bud32
VETDPTQPGLAEAKHPTLAELRDAADDPGVAEHLAQCTLCRAIVSGTPDPNSGPVMLEMPKGLVSETAFRWPAQPIARGGMAEIFSAEDRRLSRTVILKAPREGDELAAGMAEMFRRRVTAEARILAKLQHPAIVTIYELGKASVGWPFCVLQRVEGISLRDKLDELAEAEAATGAPRTRERLELLSSLVGIAEALAYAHERRVVHRDCTPNNILLGKRGEATLIDWGIARDLDAPGLGAEATLGQDDPSMSGRMVTISAGTPPYLPLEQSQGRAADPSFDVYSFGVTLYEVVSGRTPFEWKTVEPGKRTRQIESFLEWLKSDEDVPPAQVKDPELSGIVARAMTRDANRRFTSDELVRALKQYLTGDLVFSHRYSPTGRMARWIRGHRAASVTVAFLIASGVAAAGVSTHLSRTAREEAEMRSEKDRALAEASQKSAAAEKANADAAEAQARAEEAQREGKNADALRADAEKKRQIAEHAKSEAQKSAERAAADSAEAQKDRADAQSARETAEQNRDAAMAAQQAAEHDRDTARAAREAAERDRDAAKAERDAADKERDAAKASAVAAEADRDAARTGQQHAEADREAARTAQQNAEKERDAATAARAGVEKERDEDRKRIAELQAKLKKTPEPAEPPPAPAPAP